MPSLPRPGLSHIAAAAVAAAAYAYVHGSIAWVMFQAAGNDYIVHVKWAEDLYHTGRIAVPHFLYYVLAGGVYAAHLASSFLLAGRLVVIGAYALAAVLIYAVLWVVFHADRRIGRAPVLLAATGAVLVFQPIARVPWYTIGYLWNDPYNAPTFTLLRPFAVAGFFLTVRFLFGRRRAGWGVLLVYFLAVAGGALAKPSYLICLLPAAAILAVLRVLRRAPLSPGALLIGFALPALAVLGWQYLQVFSARPDVVQYRDTIGWAPLRVMHHYASGLVAKFLLSTAFPLAVLLLHWKTAWRDGMIQLAWLTFFFGASYVTAVGDDPLGPRQFRVVGLFFAVRALRGQHGLLAAAGGGGAAAQLAVVAGTGLPGSPGGARGCRRADGQGLYGMGGQPVRWGGRKAPPKKKGSK